MHDRHDSGYIIYVVFACIIRVGGGLKAYFRECMGWWCIRRGDFLVHGVGMSLLAVGCCGALAMLMSSIFGWLIVYS